MHSFEQPEAERYQLGVPNSSSKLMVKITSSIQNSNKMISMKVDTMRI